MRAVDYAQRTPQEVRLAIRNKEWKGPTAGMAKGHVQANLVILPKDWAYDFLVFAQRNPKPCPVLDITEPGTLSLGLWPGGLTFAPTCPSTGFGKMASL